MRTAMLLTILPALLLAGCTKTRDARKDVNVLMYSEYIDKQTQADFEKASGMRLRISTYENSEEMMAKLAQPGGTGQFDVVVASDVVVLPMVRKNLVQKLDLAQIPNAENVEKRFRHPVYDPKDEYTLPYQWGTVGLLYRKGKLPEGELSWAVLFDPARQAGPFVLMDSVRDMMGIALKSQGKSVNSRDAAEVRAAGELLAQAKKAPLCRGFEGGVGGVNKVLAKEAVAAVAYNGDAVRAMKDDAELSYGVPREGGIIWVDVMMLTAKAPNAAGGLKFINHILDGKQGSQLSIGTSFATPNSASLPLIPKEDRDNTAIYPPEAQAKTLEYLEDVGDDLRTYTEVWTAMKSR